ncbi:MAG: hypothetical protein SGPRY_012592 [Prymnesium sp.]
MVVKRSIPAQNDFECKSGRDGLGLELNQRNEIVSLLPNGNAAAQGLLHVEDVIVGVDGDWIDGRSFEEAIAGKKHFELQLRRSHELELHCSSVCGGLGIEVDMTNTITRLIEGGCAEKEKLLRVGDVLIAADGEVLGDRHLWTVISHERPSHILRVLRTQAPNSSHSAASAAAYLPQPQPLPISHCSPLSSLVTPETACAGSSMASSEEISVSGHILSDQTGGPWRSVKPLPRPTLRQLHEVYV